MRYIISAQIARLKEKLMMRFKYINDAKRHRHIISRKWHLLYFAQEDDEAIRRPNTHESKAVLCVKFTCFYASQREASASRNMLVEPQMRGFVLPYEYQFILMKRPIQA